MLNKKSLLALLILAGLVTGGVKSAVIYTGTNGSTDAGDAAVSGSDMASATGTGATASASVSLEFTIPKRVAFAVRDGSGALSTNAFFNPARASVAASTNTGLAFSGVTMAAGSGTTTCTVGSYATVPANVLANQALTTNGVLYSNASTNVTLTVNREFVNPADSANSKASVGLMILTVGTGGTYTTLRTACLDNFTTPASTSTLSTSMLTVDIADLVAGSSNVILSSDLRIDTRTLTSTDRAGTYSNTATFSIATP